MQPAASSFPKRHLPKVCKRPAWHRNLSDDEEELAPGVSTSDVDSALFAIDARNIAMKVDVLVVTADRAYPSSLS